VIEPCSRNGLIGFQLGDFCPQCHHCVGVHDDKGLCGACLTKDALILQVQSKDTIVFRVEKHVPHDVAARLMDMAHEIWPDNRTVLMTGGVEIEIVRPEDG